MTFPFGHPLIGSEPQAAFSRWVDGLVIALALMALWVAATPYIGIDNDARLYVPMAMRALHPQLFAQDFWFAGQSQSDWTAYALILGRLIDTFGIEPGARIATYVQGALFVAAAAVFCRSLIRGRTWLLAALLVVSVPICYSAGNILFLSEGFVTARLLTAALSLFALALVRRHRWSGWGLHGLALSLHPIMALGPAVVSLYLCLGWNRFRWIVLTGGVLGVIVFGLGAAGWLPVVDGLWLEAVRPSPLVFIDSWWMTDMARLVLVTGWMGVSIRYGARTTRPLYFAACLTAGGGVVVSLAASLIPVAIALQAQTWRAVWLVFLLALVAVAELGGRYLLRRGAKHRVSLGTGLCAGAVVFLVDREWAYWIFGCIAWGLVVVPTPLLTRVWNRAAVLPRAAMRRLFIGMALVMIVVFVGALRGASMMVEAVGWWQESLDGFFRTGGWGAAALLVWLAWVRFGKTVVLLAVCVPAWAFALNHWDARAPIQRAQEQRYAVRSPAAPFAQWIHPSDVVYWHEQPERVWMELGASGYASSTHCTGLVFSRARTELLWERMPRVAARSLDEASFNVLQSTPDFRRVVLQRLRPGSVPRAHVLASYEARADATPFGIRHLCADQALDWVIDPLRVDGAYVAVSRDRLGPVSVDLHLYDCRILRGLQRR